MRLLSKNTQTLIGSLICSILFVISPNITQSQEVFAITDPLSTPNNKFGIHIISPGEISAAASMVNYNGDWGYLTFVIQSDDRDPKKWQQVFNELRRRHLVPIVRLATKPVGDYWERPYEKEEQAWADFLNSLNWPTKNRYVVIYNEPNHASEWGNSTDPKSYAETLDKFITTLKSKNSDFFVLNAGFDASTPHQPPNYYDEERFLIEMEEHVPGIFNKLDGFVSHSYPNPGFVGLPQDTGRGSVRTYLWEIELLRSLGITKELPIFITETGWKHSDGLGHNANFPSPEVVSEYYKVSFDGAWSDPQIVAVTPFLLSYQQAPFDHFSFQVLGASSQQFHPQYLTLKNLPKVNGSPDQKNQAELVSFVKKDRDISLLVKNTGQSIWNEREQIKLVSSEGVEIIVNQQAVTSGYKRVEPGEEYIFNVPIKLTNPGTYIITYNLYSGKDQFESPPLEVSVDIEPSFQKASASIWNPFDLLKLIWGVNN